MSDQNAITTASLVWQGVTVSIRFEADWLNMSEVSREHSVDHLEIEVVAPEGAILPITETGYRSHFEQSGRIAAAGGPEAFVRSWLDEAAKDRKWRKREEAARQLSLF